MYWRSGNAPNGTEFWFELKERIDECRKMWLTGQCVLNARLLLGKQLNLVLLSFFLFRINMWTTLSVWSRCRMALYEVMFYSSRMGIVSKFVSAVLISWHLNVCSKPGSLKRWEKNRIFAQSYDGKSYGSEQVTLCFGQVHLTLKCLTSCVISGIDACYHLGRAWLPSIPTLQTSMDGTRIHFVGKLFKKIK